MDFWYELNYATVELVEKESSGLKQKILLLLFGGLALGFSYSPYKHRRIFKTVVRELKKIDERVLWQKISNLYRSKSVEKRENPDGSFTIVLTRKGKLESLTYRFEQMKIERKDWDGKWRAVVFDVPEKLRGARDALRNKLREIGFCELQKSVFVFPFECRDEIDFVIEFFDLRRYVRVGLLEEIDNNLHLKKLFNLD